MKKLLFVVTLLAGIAPGGLASGATIKINYTGQVTEVNDSAKISGYSVGEEITGEMILSLPNLPDYTAYDAGVPFVHEYDGTGSNTINGHTISGAGSLDSRSLSYFANIGFGVSEQIGNVQYGESLFFEALNVAPLLDSLDKLPTSLVSIENFLQGPLDQSTGGYIFVNEPGAHLWDIRWNVGTLAISPVAQAPAPGTFLLFATALIGIYLLGVARCAPPITATRPW
jgi:hypothetical protein